MFQFHAAGRKRNITGAMNPESDHELLMEMHRALYGDRDNGTKGIVQMNKEMYDSWSALIWAGKVITAIVVFLGAVGTAWVAFGSWVKHLFTNH